MLDLLNKFIAENSVGVIKAFAEFLNSLRDKK